MSQNNEALVRRWYNEIWNERRPAAIYELFALDGLGHVEGAEMVGPEQFHQYYKELITVFPDLRITVDEVISQDEAAAVRWTVEATHEGAGFGIEPTGRTVKFRGMTCVHIHDGKIVEGWDSWNLGALMQQLSVMSYKLKDEDYLKLWMYFQDRADNVKEAMFKTLTWTVGFAAALLGFIFVNLTNYDALKAKVMLSSVVIMASAAGLVICLYAWFMLSESGKHIQGNWGRADRCRVHVENLGEMIHGDNKQERNTMEIWNQLRIIVVLFAIAFAAILAWSMTTK